VALAPRGAANPTVAQLPRTASTLGPGKKSRLRRRPEENPSEPGTVRGVAAVDTPVGGAGSGKHAPGLKARLGDLGRNRWGNCRSRDRPSPSRTSGARRCRRGSDSVTAHRHAGSGRTRLAAANSASPMLKPNGRNTGGTNWADPVTESHRGLTRVIYGSRASRRRVACAPVTPRPPQSDDHARPGLFSGGHPQLGYHGGKSVRLVGYIHRVSRTIQPACPSMPETGHISCAGRRGWAAITVPGYWISGVCVAVLTRCDQVPVDTPGVDEVETDRRRVAVIGSVGSGEMPDPGPHRGTGLVDRGQRSLAKASARCRDAVTDIPREPATATTPDQDVGSAIGFLGARMAVGVDRLTAGW